MSLTILLQCPSSSFCRSMLVFISRFNALAILGVLFCEKSFVCGDPCWITKYPKGHGTSRRLRVKIRRDNIRHFRCSWLFTPSSWDSRGPHQPSGNQFVLHDITYRLSTFGRVLPTDKVRRTIGTVYHDRLSLLFACRVVMPSMKDFLSITHCKDRIHP